MSLGKGEIVKASSAMAMAAVALCFATFSAGCGGGGGSSSEATTGAGEGGGSTASSQAESTAAEATEEGPSGSGSEGFLEEATAVCEHERENGFAKVAEYQQKVQAEAKSQGLSHDELLRKATRMALIGIVEAELKALRTLEPPPSDNGEFEAMLAAVQKAVNEAKAHETAHTTGTETAEYLGSADKQIRAYGLPRCIKGG